jgi:hypothetical protein
MMRHKEEKITMALGPGKYDEELGAALEACGATRGILATVDGREGPGFTCRLTLEDMTKVVAALRAMADEIEANGFDDGVVH